MRRIDSDERQRSTAVTPSRPVFSCMMGSVGAAPTASLTFVSDKNASPSSRRLAFDTAALRMRPTRLPPRAVSPVRKRWVAGRTVRIVRSAWPALGLALCLCLTAVSLGAQEIRTLTLRDAVRLALERNPDVLLAQVRREKAEHGVAVAKSAFSGFASVGSGLGWSEGIPQSVEGATPSIVQATAHKTVYDRGLRKRIAQARAESGAAEASEAAQDDEIAFRVAAAYLDFESASRRVELLAERVDRFRTVAETIAARVEAGRAIPLELSKANLDQARAGRELKTARGSHKLLQTTLRLQLGLGDDVRLSTTPSEPLPALPLPASASAGVARALENSPELDSLRQSARAKGLAVEAEKGARYPRLDFVAQYSLLAKFNNFEEFFSKFQRHNGQVGLALRVPIFTGKAVSSRVARAGVERREAELELAARRSSVEAESYELYQALENAQGAGVLAKLELDYARESLDVRLAQFEAGRAALDSVEQARILESIAWQTFYDAKYELEKAKLNLLRRTGDLAAALR